MTNAPNTLQWGSIRESLREPLTRLIDGVQTPLGGRLRSVTVVGSALTDDFRPGISDVNTVIVLDEHTIAALNAVASLAKSRRRSGLSAPLMMTAPYIERSRDVFGVEFLDFQLTHQTVLGDDPFANLRFEKRDVRLQCERELKATLVRLRQGWVASAGDRRLVREILVATAKGLAPLMRAMLWLTDVDRPKTMAATLTQASTRFHIDLDAAIRADRWRQEKPRLSDSDIESAFVAIVDAVDRLAAAIDEMEP